MPAYCSTLCRSRTRLKADRAHAAKVGGGSPKTFGRALRHASPKLRAVALGDVRAMRRLRVASAIRWECLGGTCGRPVAGYDGRN